MFPYASEQLESYLRDHWGEEECENDVDQLREQVNQTSVLISSLQHLLHLLNILQYKADKQDDSKQGVPNIPEKDSATKEEYVLCTSRISMAELFYCLYTHLG